MILKASFPEWQKTLSDDERKTVFKAYTQLLSDLASEVLKEATLRHIKTSKFFPKIAELRELATTVEKELKEQARIARQIALHPEWYTPPQPQVEDKSERLVPVGRILHRFANVIANGKALS